MTADVTCPACLGNGMGHFRRCSYCAGTGVQTLRIAVAADTTGTAPEWAQWQALDADRYDGSPDAGRCGAVGLGRTPDEAVADLIEQLERCV